MNLSQASRVISLHTPCSWFPAKTAPPTTSFVPFAQALKPAAPVSSTWLSFGQHGVSSALLGLLSRFGLGDEEVPTLALFSSPQAEAVHTVALAPGEPAGTTDSADSPNDWQAILGQVERTADGEASALALESLPVSVDHHEVQTPVLEVVAGLLRELS